MRKKLPYSRILLVLVLVLIILIILDIFVMSSVLDDGTIPIIKQIFNIPTPETLSEDTTQPMAESIATQPETTSGGIDGSEAVTTDAETTERDTSRITDAETEPPAPAPYVLTGQVGLSAAVDSSYFDDALFIGDSRTMGFCNFTGMNYCYAQVSLGVSNALSTTVLTVWENGAQVQLNVIDALRRNKDKFTKIYVCLGVNDHTNYPDYYITNYKTLIKKIIDTANYGTMIYVESILPINDKKAAENKYSVKNSQLYAMNAALSDMCDELGVHLVNVAEAVTDNNFSIPYDFTNDGIHFNMDACLLVKNYLCSHTVSPSVSASAENAEEDTAAEETTAETVGETTAETVEETKAETVGETAAETVEETTAETIAETETEADGEEADPAAGLI